MSENKVRQRIAYAQDKGEISKTDDFDVKEFFTWANEKWPELNSFIKLSYTLEIQNIACQTKISSPTLLAPDHSLPEGRQELERLCKDKIKESSSLSFHVGELGKEIQDNEKLIDQLQREVDTLKKQNEEYLTEKNRRSEVAKKNGSKRYS